jgi:hypothetical protein
VVPLLFKGQDASLVALLQRGELRKVLSDPHSLPFSLLDWASTKCARYFILVCMYTTGEHPFSWTAISTPSPSPAGHPQSTSQGADAKPLDCLVPTSCDPYTDINSGGGLPHPTIRYSSSAPSHSYLVAGVTSSTMLFYVDTAIVRFI